MFKNLTVFSTQRDAKGALGFYLAYFLLGILLGGLIGGLSSLFVGAKTSAEGFQLGLKIGPYVGLVYCLVITGMVIHAKHAWSNFLFLILFIASGLLAMLGGALLGLIPVAILTTKASS